jgi:hypothetical protein
VTSSREFALNAANSCGRWKSILTWLRSRNENTHAMFLSLNEKWSIPFILHLVVCNEANSYENQSHPRSCLHSFEVAVSIKCKNFSNKHWVVTA